MRGRGCRSYNKKTNLRWPFCICVCLPPVAINGESHESTAEPFVMSGGTLRGGALDSLPCCGFLFLLATEAKSPYRSTMQSTKAMRRHWGGTGARRWSEPHIHGATLQSREENDGKSDENAAANLLSTHEEYGMWYVECGIPHFTFCIPYSFFVR